MPFDSCCVDCKVPGDDCPPGMICSIISCSIMLIYNFAKFGESANMSFICIVF